MSIKGTLWTAGSFSQSQVDEVCARFTTLLGDKVLLDVHENPGLIAGFVAQIEGRVYDASVRGTLDDFAKGSENAKEKMCAGMKISTQDIGPKLVQAVDSFDPAPRVYDYGTVTSSHDGIVCVEGLPGRCYGELLAFDNDVFAMALDLDGESVGAVLLADEDKVSVGALVRGTGKVAEAPIGDMLLSRVVDPLGRPLDGMALNPARFRAIEQSAPSIMDRQAVNRPMETGLLAIDSMITIGRGQRELIIGDRQTGKTQIAIDTILNQKGKDVICIYCAIGQKASTVQEIIETLRRSHCLDYCVVVSSTASDAAAMQYIAPYAACAMAEGFMLEGKDVLVVYDDLSKHAVAYRAMSLLLQRPPGREAYPGDVFYLHSRLLERSAHLRQELGGGSMTALPIIETMAGDISAYIPTNVISITDGQIFLDSELFHSGVRPAVNVGLSVSRVGRSAQHKAMQKVSGTLRIDLAQYRELAVFSQFGSDIDDATKTLLDRGERLTQTLKQEKRRPLKLSEQVSLLLAYREDAMQRIAAGDVTSFNKGLLTSLAQNCCEQLHRIDMTGDLEEADREVLVRQIHRYAQGFKDENENTENEKTVG